MPAKGDLTSFFIPWQTGSVDEVTKALLSYGVLGIAVIVLGLVVRRLWSDLRALDKQRHDELIAIVTEQASANAKATNALEHTAESIDKLVDALYQNPNVRPRLPSRS